MREWIFQGLGWCFSLSCLIHETKPLEPMNLLLDAIYNQCLDILILRKWLNVLVIDRVFPQTTLLSQQVSPGSNVFWDNLPGLKKTIQGQKEFWTALASYGCILNPRKDRTTVAPLIQANCHCTPIKSHSHLPHSHRLSCSMGDCLSFANGDK